MKHYNSMSVCCEICSTRSARPLVDHRGSVAEGRTTNIKAHNSTPLSTRMRHARTGKTPGMRHAHPAVVGATPRKDARQRRRKLRKDIIRLAAKGRLAVVNQRLAVAALSGLIR